MSTVGRQSPHEDPEAAADVALAEYLARIDLGEPVDRRKFIFDHPNVASELQDYFATAEILEGAVAELSSGNTPGRGGDKTTPMEPATIAGQAGSDGGTADPAPLRSEYHASWPRRFAWPLVAVTLGSIVAAALALIPGSPGGLPGVRITTEPPATHGALVPRNSWSGLPDLELLIRAKTVGAGGLVFDDVPPGEYLLEVARAGHGFQEVIRYVPAPGESPGALAHQSWREENGEIVLAPVAIPLSGVTGGATYCRGDSAFRMGDSRSLPAIIPEHFTAVAPFYLDCHEVTVADYARVNVAPRAQPDVKAHAAAPDAAVSYVSFDEAVAFAEAAGKRLPDEQEYEWAATGGGTRRFPWGDDTQSLRTWSYGAAHENAMDQTPDDPPIVGLYSNVAEWTWSTFAPYPTAPPDGFRAGGLPSGAVTVRGGPYSVAIGKPDATEIVWGPRYRKGFQRTERHSGLGFRCARSAAPRFLPREAALESLFEPGDAPAGDGRPATPAD